jgi:putative FmdB family regulatory protein
MPVYEFSCAACGEHFEIVSSLSERDERAVCPACGGRTVTQVFSGFRVGISRTRLTCTYVDPQGVRRELPVDGHAVAICNGRTFGGGMRIAPMAQLDDGLLDVILFQTRTRLRLVRRFGTVYAGTHLLEPGVDHFTCRELELRPAGPVSSSRPRAGLFPLDVDGDALGDVPVAAGVVPAALRVRAPLGAV